MRRCWKHQRAILRIWSTIVIAPGLLVVGQWATLRATPREVDRDGPRARSAAGSRDLEGNGCRDHGATLGWAFHPRLPARTASSGGALPVAHPSRSPGNRLGREPAFYDLEHRHAVRGP